MCLESGSLNFRSPHFQSLDNQSLSIKKCPHAEIWSEMSFFQKCPSSLSPRHGTTKYFFQFGHLYFSMLSKQYCCQGTSVNGWEPEAWDTNDHIYCSADFIGLISSGHKEREGSLTLSLPRGQKRKEECKIETVIYFLIITTRFGISVQRIESH